MKRAMYLLIAGTVLSGIAAFSASGRTTGQATAAATARPTASTGH